MKLKPGELKENNYRLLDSMDHNELIPFVKTYLNKRTFASTIYYLSIIISVAVLLFYSMKIHVTNHTPVSKEIACFLIGVPATFLLIPLHEFIHIIAYKLQGATATSYDYNLKKFYFLAVADKFVANKKEFRIVALAPFVIITAALMISLFFVGPLAKIIMLTTLTIHTTCCSGDFALLSYFEFNKDKEVITYDDKDNKISYFYVKDEAEQLHHV